MHILVIGLGALGRATAGRLVESNHHVTVATRHGTAFPGAHSVALDITASEAAERILALHQRDPLTSVVLCCNFPYGKWRIPWDAATRAAIEVGRSTGAAMVLAGNLYAYGPANEPLHERMPLSASFDGGRVRANVWQRLLRASEQYGFGATEIRGSDYLGPGAGANAHAGDRLLLPLLAGKPAYPLGNIDAPHTWTVIDDFGRMLAQAATDPKLYGRPWHVPSPEPLSLSELARIATRLAGTPAPRLRPVPFWPLRALGTVSPAMRALADVSYQFTQPFVMADTDARTLLACTHTPLTTALQQALDAAHR